MRKRSPSLVSNALASLGFGVYLGDEYMGLVERYLLWGLDQRKIDNRGDSNEFLMDWSIFDWTGRNTSLNTSKS
jgi:uncharacterized protein (DUF3820 family)